MTSAGTIAASYVAGGLIPLSPYIVLNSAYRGLIVFGDCDAGCVGSVWVYQGTFTGTSAFRSALQTMVIGGVAAGVAFALAKLIS